jgi:hypothetical protein
VTNSIGIGIRGQPLYVDGCQLVKVELMAVSRPAMATGLYLCCSLVLSSPTHMLVPL